MELLFVLAVVLVILFKIASPKRGARRSRSDWSGYSEGSSSNEGPDTSRWSLELLQALEWKRFERLCAAYFEAIGFRAVVARAGADGGIDIHLFQRGETKPAIIAQCKAWNAYKVGIKPVRELFGVMAMEGVSEGIFLTTGVFTSEARSFPRDNKLHLWDGEQILAKISELPENRKLDLLRLATEGDFRTPTCPSCEIKMVVRTARRDGERFWGCANYPRCRQTFKIRA